MEGDTEGGVWYSERLESLVRFGFDRKPIEEFLSEGGTNVVDRLAWLEARREQASHLEDRIVSFRSSHPHLGLEFSTTADLLADPFSISEAFSEFERLMMQYAPWEPSLERGKVAWHEQEKGEDWSALYERLAKLDPSSITSVQILYPLFEQPERFDELFRHLNTIEMDELRQRKVMLEGVESLRSMGYTLPQVNGLELMDAFSLIERWQSFHNTAEELKLSIKQLIAPFDGQLSDELEVHRLSLKDIEDLSKLHDLEQEVARLGQTFEERRLELSTQVQNWRSQGIVFPHEGDLHPSELMEWESNLESIRESIESHLVLVERWVRFERYWPSRVEASKHLVGRIEHNDELQDAVDGLDQLWKQLELDGLSLLEHYQGSGMLLEGWRQHLLEDPLTTMESLTHLRPQWDRAIRLIEALDELDVSFEGGEGVVGRARVLRETELNDEIMDEIQRFIDERKRRSARHREMLDRELADLRISDRIEVERDTARMSINEYEHYISALHRSEHDVVSSAESSLPPRFISRLEREIELLGESGWDVDDWATALLSQPGDVARQLNIARHYIQHHEVLRRRLQHLPWNRDINRALQIESDMRRPSRLQSLSEKIPALSRHLAQREIEDATYEFSFWQPKTPRPTLVPVSAPVEQFQMPSDALEDAHEAILEEMERSDGEGVDPALPSPGPLSASTRDSPKDEAEVAEKPHARDSVAPPEQSAKENSSESPQEEVAPRAAAERPVATPKLDQSAVERGSLADGGKGTEDAIKALSVLLAQLGLTEAAHSAEHSGLEAIQDIRRTVASHVNVVPRDVRIARLLRITLRCLPDGSSDDAARGEVLTLLCGTIKPLKKWMRHRLEKRHSGASGDLLKDAVELGTALTRIPGPGRRVPMGPDEYVLPHDLAEIKAEAMLLREAIVLPSAGGVTA